jgi:addiction module HigA family antidote
MRMKYPVHPGALVADSLDDMGLSVAEAAKGLGVTRQALYNVINGKSGVSPEMAVRLAKGIGSTADTWLRMQLNYDLSRLEPDRIAVTKLVPRLPEST